MITKNFKQKLHSLDTCCEHRDLEDIHSINNLMGLYHYDAYCPHCQKIVYATKGRPMWSNDIITVPWTVSRNIGYCDNKKQYELIQTRIMKMEKEILHEAILKDIYKELETINIRLKHLKNNLYEKRNEKTEEKDPVKLLVSILRGLKKGTINKNYSVDDFFEELNIEKENRSDFFFSLIFHKAEKILNDEKY